MRPYILRRTVGMAALIAVFAGCSDVGSTDQGVKAAASRLAFPRFHGQCYAAEAAAWKAAIFCSGVT